MQISTTSVRRVEAPPIGAPRASWAPGPLDRVELGGLASRAGEALGRMLRRLRGEKSPAEMKAQVEALYEDILRDADYDAKEKQWGELVAQAEAYLARSESFEGGDFGPLMRTPTPDPNLVFVSIQAPRPHLAGTMSSNWNYLQTKQGDKVHLQRLGTQDPTHLRDARLWNDGDQQMMTVLSVAKLSTRDFVPMAAVWRRDGDDWVPVRDRFVTNTDKLEGRDLFLAEDGSLGFEEGWTGGEPLHMAFDGDSHRLMILGGEEAHALPLVDGRYVLRVKTEEEKRREAIDRETARMIDAFHRIDNGATITRSEETVDIGGVKLPVRRIKS